ncbi:uncharacterized protein LOC128750527 [Synchiropus splendidus]|uniref:uncharacterized protein LOC128750527 n=1 Tax=Synchiropus splendidus TaxID=270530 RepID=UPI00237EA9E5|nr:uncharacterized protein LOC128750527 [Synchiropus splendidus]
MEISHFQSILMLSFSVDHLKMGPSFEPGRSADPLRTGSLWFPHSFTSSSSASTGLTSQRDFWICVASTVMSSHLILLHLCTLQILVASHPACWLPGHLVLKAHNQLHALGSFPLHCLPFNSNMSFPDMNLTRPSVHQCQRVSLLVHRSLEGAEKVFRNVTPGLDIWNSQKFHEFQLTNHRLLKEGKCLPGDFSSGPLLDSYLANVTLNLLQPDKAHCAWSALRRDLYRVLNSALRHHHRCFKQ